MGAKRTSASPLFLPDGIKCPAVKVFKADEELVVGLNNISFASQALSLIHI